MITFRGTTPEVYPDILRMLYSCDVTHSRAGDTREVLNVAVESTDPRERYLDRDEKWNLPFQLQEHIAYWNGQNPGHVDRYVDMSRWLDADGKLPGSAYGDRLRNTAGHDQISRVINQLRDNPESRRAVMQVHQASVEDYSGADVSCTEMLQLFLRDGMLHMTAIIRSQDMYWGYAYDAANNQFLQELIAGILQCDVGTYTHCMTSCHYYLEYEDDVERSLNSPTVHSLPDMRLGKRDNEVTLQRLFVGLSKARDGEIPSDDIRLLDPPYDDWLTFMTAYEQMKFHDNKSAELVNAISTDWMRYWLRQRF